jgi:hypothetical protein
VIEGPGRRRTAFFLFHGVAQGITIGCRSAPGAAVPIAADATC